MWALSSEGQKETNSRGDHEAAWDVVQRVFTNCYLLCIYLVKNYHPSQLTGTNFKALNFSLVMFNPSAVLISFMCAWRGQLQAGSKQTASSTHARSLGQEPTSQWCCEGPGGPSVLKVPDSSHWKQGVKGGGADLVLQSLQMADLPE